MQNMKIVVTNMASEESKHDMNTMTVLDERIKELWSIECPMQSHL